MDSGDNGRLVGRYALGLWVTGVLFAFAFAVFGKFEEAMFLALVCEVLAMVLGVLGWRDRIARVAVYGALAMCLWAGMSLTMYSVVGKVLHGRMDHPLEGR